MGTYSCTELSAHPGRFEAIDMASNGISPALGSGIEPRLGSPRCLGGQSPSLVGVGVRKLQIIVLNETSNLGIEVLSALEGSSA